MSSILDTFTFERVINCDVAARTITFLGRASPNNAVTIVKMEKIPWDPDNDTDVFRTLEDVREHMHTDIYRVFYATLKDRVKIDVISPATETHIRKYSQQYVRMVTETPELYRNVVLKYIEGFPPERTQWVRDILSGKSEADRILYDDSDFVILPDMKWDGVTLSSLYLVAITRHEALRSIRDLKGSDVPVLKRIKEQVDKIMSQKWGMAKGGVRCYVHYQPSYYHFHVHIVNANTVGFMGATVGQAHLLDDIISLLEVDSEIMTKLTFTYGLGEQHGLYRPLVGDSLSMLETRN